jgi:hypothetical protein
MSLYRRGKKIWASFYVDGIRFQFPTGSGDRKRAEAVEQRRKSEAHALRYGIVSVDPNLTFGELADKFLASGCAKAHHADRLKQLVPFFGNMRVMSITPKVVRDYRANRKSA